MGGGGVVTDFIANAAWAMFLGGAVVGAIAAIDAIFFDDAGERAIRRWILERVRD